MDPQPALDLIGAAADGRRLVLVGIGGRGGSGKSTLAAMIPGAQVVSTDEFWTGEEFDLERLGREVVTPLASGAPARFASYDWATRATRGERAIAPAGVVVVEGVCALHRRFRDAYAVRIWVDAPYDVRLARGVARDGETATGHMGREVDAVGGPLHRPGRSCQLRAPRDRERSLSSAIGEPADESPFRGVAATGRRLYVDSRVAPSRRSGRRSRDRGLGAARRSTGDHVSRSVAV